MGSRKEWRGRMARLDRFSGYCPCRRMVLFPQTDGGKRTYGEGRGCTEERFAFLLGRGAWRAGRGCLSQQSRGPGKRPASLNITKALPDTVREGLRGILHFRNRYSRSSPFTSMRYLRIFDQRVLGLRPRSSAAPSCPEILPLVRLSALMI